MAKKRIKKDSLEKKEVSHRPKKIQNYEKSDAVPKMLVENFVALQGVMADLSSKLNNLTNQLSKLLELFEESAKTFMEKDLKIGGGEANKELSEKLDKLLEQNKVIARGLALLHESNQQEQQQYPSAPVQPQFTQSISDKYQRSITSK